MDINATFIGQIIVFLIMLWFIARVVVPMIARPIDERQKKIAEGLAAAERGQKDLSAAQSRVEEIVREARARAQQIEQQAHLQANEIIEAAKRSASSEGARILGSAESQIALAAQTNDAREGLAAFKEKRAPAWAASVESAKEAGA